MSVVHASTFKLALSDCGTIHHATNAFGKCFGMAIREKGFFEADDFRDGPAGGSESHDSAGHGLDKDMAKLLFPTNGHSAHGFAGEDEDIEAAQKSGNFEMRTWW